MTIAARGACARILLAAAGAAALGGCGPTQPGGGGDDDGLDAAAGAVDARVGPGRDGAPDPDPQADATSCGSQSEAIELVNLGDPPDLLIVLDRSGSMALAPGFPPLGTSKWTIMEDALTAITAAREANIRFGLSLFPTDDDCGVAAGTAVGIDLLNAGEIAAALADTGPGGNTPAHFGLEQALATYAALPVNPAGRYVLFATDGVPNCGGDPPNVDISTDAETVAAVAALAAADVKTYVLGFGDIFGLDPEVLNDAALAGGVPRPGGPPHFYHASSAAELEAALAAIAGGIIVPSCSYELASLPPDPGLVTVTADGTPVPRSPSHADGWDYHPDAGTITFFGAWCDAITSGAVASVDFAFGCPGPVVD